MKQEQSKITINKTNYFVRLGHDLVRNKNLYLMLLPVIIYYIVFSYYPMYGAQIAFKDFSPKLGIEGSPFVGLDNFISFFDSIYIGRLLRNTLVINFLNLILGFPAPIILAISLNEVRKVGFKKVVQTITYLPHFISIVVISGMILEFTSTNGFITNIFTYFGYPQKNLMMDPAMFKPIYVISGIWQNVGWDSIIYLAAISSINSELYEAAKIDGAGKLKQMLYVTLPGIKPTIITMLILRLGSMMSLGYEKIILLYNASIYETSDVISTYVYRKGLLDMDYSYSTAVGLLNSAINIMLLITANYVSKKVNDDSLW